MANRAVYSIYLDSDVREKARQSGLNISKITENTLRFLLQQIDGYTFATQLTKMVDSQKGTKEVHEE